MNKNIYKKWEPINNIPDELYLEGLYDDYEGFRLLLKGDNVRSKMMRIKFDSVLLYRNIDEGDLILYPRVNEQSNQKLWCLYIVSESDLLSWFHSVSQNIHEAKKLIHYAIYTPNDCIDIITDLEPNVEWLK
jgi:hypothetical protein